MSTSEGPLHCQMHSVTAEPNRQTANHLQLQARLFPSFTLFSFCLLEISAATRKKHKKDGRLYGQGAHFDHQKSSMGHRRRMGYRPALRLRRAHIVPHSCGHTHGQACLQLLLVTSCHSTSPHSSALLLLISSNNEQHPVHVIMLTGMGSCLLE